MIVPEIDPSKLSVRNTDILSLPRRSVSGFKLKPLSNNNSSASLRVSSKQQAGESVSQMPKVEIKEMNKSVK